MGARSKRPKAWGIASVPALLVPKAEWPPGWDDLALALWNVYAGYRAQFHVGTAPDRFCVPSEGKLEVMYAMKLWCEKRQIVPSLWIYSVFAALQWRSPQLGHLFSPKMEEHYRTWEGANRDLHHGAKLRADLAPPDVVYEAGEQVKRGFLSRGHAELCATSDLHGGYVAASVSCRQCPVSQKCAALRDGR